MPYRKHAGPRNPLSAPPTETPLPAPSRKRKAPKLREPSPPTPTQKNARSTWPGERPFAGSCTIEKARPNRTGRIGGF